MSETPEISREKKLEIRRHYIVTDRDAGLCTALTELAENFEDSLEGAGRKECVLFLIGSSDSGKTAALKRQFGELPAFAKASHHGIDRSPLLSLETPSPCSVKTLVSTVLEKLHIPVQARATDGLLTELLKRVLKEHQIKYLHLDEAQHTVDSVAAGELQSVRDKIKSLAQITDWPIQLILSGTENLAGLIEGHSELSNRAFVIRFGDLEDRNVATCIKLIERVVENLCGLDASAIKNELFAIRLIRSCNGAWGTIINFLKEASLLALSRGDSAVRVQDFADHVYRRTAERPAQNPFVVPVGDGNPASTTLVNIRPETKKRRKQ